MRELLENCKAFRRKGSWLVLSLGFGGLLLFLLAAASGTLLVLNRARHEETAMRKSFLERLSALDQIRAQIYLSGTYIRDFLLSPDAASAAAQRARLAALEADTHRALDAYAGSLEPEERQPFLALQSEIEAYWRFLDQTIARPGRERTTAWYAFFYEELVPRRTAMLQIADRITGINEQGLNHSEEKLAHSSEALRRSLLLTFGVALLGSFALALLTIGYTLRLERELERRLEENTRAKADLRDLSSRLLRAQEEERRSLARELHDEVGQSLSAILMESENAGCAETPREMLPHLDSIRALAERTVNQVRDLALLLRPSMLDDFGLVPALNWHCREMTKRTGLKIVVLADSLGDDLPEEHTTCVYRLVQEAVNNAARHAKARAVEVCVRRAGDRVIAAVQDDGAGFEAHFVRGLGLLGMEERVRRMGGEFRVESQPGRGTRILAELPLPELHARNGYVHSHSAG